MANKNAKVAKNVAGKFYVDSGCINCGMCYSSASDFFAEDSASGVAYVKTQPNNDAGIKICREALDSCPVGVIGDDGE